METIRAFRPDDMSKVREIHDRFFKEEFEFPNFLKNYYCAYVIEVDQNPIVIGGVRPIAEVVAVTDLDASPRNRINALRKMLEAAVFTTAIRNHDQLHCFVQDDTWLRQLETVHFRPTAGRSLVLDVG